MKKLLLILLCLPLLFSTCKKESKITDSLPEACEPDEQVYLELVQPIIESNCIQCHSASGSRPETPLEIYEGVIDALNNHSLRDKVSSLQMPPYGAPPMSESDINIIKNWADCE